MGAREGGLDKDQQDGLLPAAVPLALALGAHRQWQKVIYSQLLLVGIKLFKLLFSQF